MYRSPERSPRDTRDEFDLHSAQASFDSSPVDLARPLRRVDYILRVVRGLVSLAAKASLVPVSDAIIFLRSLYVYLPLVF